MNFKERFKGKISIVDKKGLKLALMQPLKLQPLIGVNNQETLRQLSMQSSNLQKANWRRMSRASRFSKIVENEESFSSGKKLRTEQQYFTPVLKKKDRFFVDQMEQKHENFLKKLEKRTRYNTVVS